MQCPRCKKLSPPESIICTDCGHQLNQPFPRLEFLIGKVLFLIIASLPAILIAGLILRFIIRGALISIPLGVAIIWWIKLCSNFYNHRGFTLIQAHLKIFRWLCGIFIGCPLLLLIISPTVSTLTDIYKDYQKDIKSKNEAEHYHINKQLSDAINNKPVTSTPVSNTALPEGYVLDTPQPRTTFTPWEYYIASKAYAKEGKYEESLAAFSLALEALENSPLADIDKQALAWSLDNPKDDRAIRIFEKLAKKYSATNNQK